jgi:hypothetical protein
MHSLASVSIPKGSILAVGSISIIYITQIIFFGSTVVRYATGNIADVQYNNYTCHQSQGCDYGLINDQWTMSLTSSLTRSGINTHHIEPIFTAGLLSQALSSAMCSFIAAPQVFQVSLKTKLIFKKSKFFIQYFQSLASDKLLPFTVWFAKGYGKLNDPRRGYVLTFIIALAFIAIADFDIIAGVISNCYLSSWALVNISCFHSAYVSSSSWRPKFKYFNKWISLLCGLTCFVLMFCFDYISTLCLLSLMSIIWFSIYVYKPGIDL